MKKTGAAHTAGLIGISHFLFSLLIQLETYLLYLTPPSVAPGHWPPFDFLGRQSENILVAAALGAGFLLAPKFPVYRWTYGVICGLVNGFLVVDQLFYRLFNTHFHLSFTSDISLGEIPLFMDSLLSELNWVFYCNAVVWLILSVYLWIRITGCTKVSIKGPVPWKRATAALALTALYFCISALSGRHEKPAPLSGHPVYQLVESALSPNGRPAPEQLGDFDLKRLRFGTVPPEPRVDQQLHRISRSFAEQKDLPNVVLIIIESVGSLQMLPKSRLDPSHTPELFALQDRMVAFDNLYSVFPGTTRTHLAIATGGSMITWGSVYRELNLPYTGPALNRELKRRGYGTGLFSAGHMKIENLVGLYRNLKYDRLYDPSEESPAFLKWHRINSWGINEEAVLATALQWIDGVAQTGKPFFLEFLPRSTHHPYGTPDGYRGPYQGRGRKERYYNSLHFVDKVIGDLVRGLRERNLWSNTLLFVMGDHGQAFGEYHPGNFTHKNYLYEENIRNFLLVIHPNRIHRYVGSHRPAGVGDVMATVLSRVDPAYVPPRGRDLFSRDFQPRLEYFHKSASPQLWGVLDGQWKFIARKDGKFTPQLYNLASDPFETTNLAGRFPHRVRVYERLLPVWYFTRNHEFTAQLRGYESPGRSIPPAIFPTPGPKAVVFGVNPRNSNFKRLSCIHPYETFYASTVWIPYGEWRAIQVEWTSPSGRLITSTVKIHGNQFKRAIVLDAPRPLEEGPWEFKLYDGEKLLMERGFRVDASAPVHSPCRAYYLRQTRTSPR